MGALVVGTALIVAFVLLVELFERRKRREIASDRNRWNHKVRLVYLHAGARWYPHEMADGRVRWYTVTDDHAVDL